MKTIDRAFAMKMLERIFGKSQPEIVDEATRETGDWPMGMSELEASLSSKEHFAKATIAHFHGHRPSVITDQDIQSIRYRSSGRIFTDLTHSEAEHFRMEIQLVLDLYDNEP